MESTDDKLQNVQNVHDLRIALEKANDCIAGMQNEIRLHGIQLKDLWDSQGTVPLQKSSSQKTKEETEIQRLDSWVKSNRRKLKSIQEELLVASDTAKAGLERHKRTELLVISLQQQLRDCEYRISMVETDRRLDQATLTPHRSPQALAATPSISSEQSNVAALPSTYSAVSVSDVLEKSIIANKSLAGLASKLNTVATARLGTSQTGCPPSDLVIASGSSGLNLKMTRPEMTEEDCDALAALVRPLLLRVESLEMRLATVDALEASARAFTSRASALEEFSDVVDRLTRLEAMMIEIKGSQQKPKASKKAQAAKGRTDGVANAPKEEGQSSPSNPARIPHPSDCPLWVRLDSLRCRLNMPVSTVPDAARRGQEGGAVPQAGELQCYDLFEKAIGELTGCFQNFKASSEEVTRSLRSRFDNLEHRLKSVETKQSRGKVGEEDDIMGILGPLMSRVMCVEGKLVAAEQLRTAREGEIKSQLEVLEKETWNSSPQMDGSMAADGIWCRVPGPHVPKLQLSSTQGAASSDLQEVCEGASEGASATKEMSMKKEISALSLQAWKLLDQRVTVLENSVGRLRRQKIVLTTSRRPESAR